MIRYETFCKIQDLHLQRGLTVAQIARALGLDRKTVGKWVNAKSFRPLPSECLSLLRRREKSHGG